VNLFEEKSVHCAAMPTGKRPHVVIIGAGFGGLSVVRTLAKAPVDITLIDRTNHHLFQPLLYQVATAGLSPGDIAHPIRQILRKMKNVHVVMDEVFDIDLASDRVLGIHDSYPYDHLIIATGSRHSYFGNDEWEQHAPGLKDLGDAVAIRDRILRTFEEAERHIGTPRLRELLSFVIVGGGPTGVELAGAIAEIARKTMLPDFPRLAWSDIRVLLLEGGDRILPGFTPDLAQHAHTSLERMGVEVIVQCRVTDVTSRRVRTGRPAVGTDEWIPSANVLWAAGNQASSLCSMLNVAKDRVGRIKVGPHCEILGHEKVFVIGDAAYYEENGKPLPGVAQVAMQQGRHVGRLLRRRIAHGGKQDDGAAFRYKDLGSMATIGRAAAIADLGWVKLHGLIAWLAWAGLHVLQLISFRNRLRVLIEWTWFYITFQPGARLLLKDRSDVER
jgi:NADH:ubiquinone reductase (H+-translocating)